MIPEKTNENLVSNVFENLRSKEKPLESKLYKTAIHTLITSEDSKSEIKSFCKKIMKIQDETSNQESNVILAIKKSHLIGALLNEFSGNPEKLNNKHIKNLIEYLDKGLLLDKDRIVVKQMLAKLENKPIDEIFTTVESLGETTTKIIKEKLGLKPGDLVFMGYKPIQGTFVPPPKSSEEAVRSVGHSAMWVEGDKNLAHVCYAKGTFSTGGATLTGLLTTDTYAIFRCKRQELTQKVANLGYKLCSQKKNVTKDKLLESYPDYLPVEVVKKKILKVENELKKYSVHNKTSLENNPLFDRLFGKIEAKEINGVLCVPVWDGSGQSWISKQDNVKKNPQGNDNLYEQKLTKYNHLNGLLTKKIFLDEQDLEVPDQFKSEEIRRSIKFATKYNENSLTEKSGVRCSEFIIALFHSAAFEKEASSNPEKLKQNLESASQESLKEHLPSSFTIGSKLIRTNYLAQKVNNDDEFEYVGYFDIVDKGVIIGYPSGEVEYVKNK